MELDQLKQEVTLCSPEEQDALAAHLLYLRLKRKPKQIEALHYKVNDPTLASWSEELFASDE